MQSKESNRKENVRKEKLESFLCLQDFCLFVSKCDWFWQLAAKVKREQMSEKYNICSY